MIILAPVFIFVLWFAFEFARSFYYISNDYVKYQDKWYKQEDLPREATEEFGDIRAKLRAVPVLRTPEETYSLFRNALLGENYEEALQYIAVEKRDDYRYIFEDKQKVKEWASKLPEEIKKESDGEFRLEYSYDISDKYYHSIHFVKEFTGYWMIKSI